MKAADYQQEIKKVKTVLIITTFGSLITFLVLLQALGAGLFHVICAGLGFTGNLGMALVVLARLLQLQKQTSK